MFNIFGGISKMWKTLTNLAPKYKKMFYIEMAVFAIVGIYGSVINPLIITRIFHALELNDTTALFINCGIGALLIASNIVLCYINNVYMDMYCFKIVYTAIKNSCKRLFRIPYDSITDNFEDSDIHNRISTGTRVFIGFFGNIVLILANTLAILLLLGLAGTFSIALLTFALIATIISAIATGFEYKRRQKLEKILLETDSKSEGIIYNAVNQIDFARMYGLQNEMMDNYRQNRDRTWALKWKQEKLSLWSSSLVELVNSFFRGSLGFVFYNMRTKTPLSDEVIASSFTIYDQLRGLTNGYADPFRQINSAIVGIDRFDELFGKYGDTDTDAVINDKCTYIKIKGVKLDIAERTILDVDSFTINKGEKVAIIGANGSGKSTLLKMICGVHHAKSGSVELMGINLNEMSNDVRRTCLTYIPSTDYLYSVSVKDNILMNANVDGDDLLDEAIKLAEVTTDGENSFIDSLGTELSGGQAQRVNIARGFMNKAPILIADEPTAGLPVSQGNSILNNLLTYSDTAIIVTHNNDHLKNFDRIIIMEQGKIAADTTLQNLDNCPAYINWVGQLGNKKS